MCVAESKGRHGGVCRHGHDSLVDKTVRKKCKFKFVRTRAVGRRNGIHRIIAFPFEREQ
jgi:hypothetical protein